MGARTASAPSLEPFGRTVRRIWRHPANRGRRLPRMGAWVAWQAWERVVGRPWTVTMPPGLSIELAPHDPVASGVLYCGLPDWPEMPFVLDYLQAGDVMVDVGANIALYTLLAASVEGVRVIAFEPDPGARRQAAANVARNRLADRVELRADAVGAVPGEAAFTVGLGPLNRLVAPDRPAGDVRTVAVVALDAVVDGPVALLKVDVEGHEVAVLQGADHLLRAYHPALIVEANDPDRLTGLLETYGYRWVRYDPAQRRVIPAATAPEPAENGIAVFDIAMAEGRVSR